MMEKEKKKNFYDFCEIIAALRAPDGCPWDREQTHKSLSKHLIEEAYEAKEAVDEGNPEKMADELGDVLLQIVMHSQIGKEEGTFTIDDVIESVSEKMIKRHPHVFGDTKVENSAQVLENWEDIKKAQRGQKYVYEELEHITPSLPALYRCNKVIGKAKKAGFIEKINSAVYMSEEEIGEKLFEICILANQNNLNPEEALSSYTKNFIKKIKNIEENT